MYMRAVLLVGLLLSSLSLALSVQAVVEVYDFEDEQLRQRYLSFIDELRCPKCQNQNLAGSDSPIASDLRRELRHLLENGRSDKEIIDFMVQRYGDYVLYKPKVQRTTFVLWGLPLGMGALGLIVLVFVLRRRKPDEQSDLREVDQERLNTLLNKAADRNSKDS